MNVKITTDDKSAGLVYDLVPDDSKRANKCVKSHNSILKALMNRFIVYTEHGMVCILSLGFFEVLSRGTRALIQYKDGLHWW